MNHLLESRKSVDRFFFHYSIAVVLMQYCTLCRFSVACTASINCLYMKMRVTYADFSEVMILFPQFYDFFRECNIVKHQSLLIWTNYQFLRNFSLISILHASLMTVLQNSYASLTALTFVWLIAAFPYEQKNVPWYKPLQPFNPWRDTRRLISLSLIKKENCIHSTYPLTKVL